VSGRLAVALAIAVAVFARAEIAEADCTDAGACPSNQYCATSAGDAGVFVSDGGAGVCVPEPCVVSTDCTNGDLCDTSQQPFKCVECISTADCSGNFSCDVATHTCVPSPVAGDGGTGDDAATEEDDGGSAGDASEEGIDATLPGAALDAGSEATAQGSPDANTDTGTLAGGACDCTLATPRDSGVAAFGASLALGLIAVARRRARSQRKAHR
jgi:hypothetical protein